MQPGRIIPCGFALGSTSASEIVVTPSAASIANGAVTINIPPHFATAAQSSSSLVLSSSHLPVAISHDFLGGSSSVKVAEVYVKSGQSEPPYLTGSPQTVPLSYVNGPTAGTEVLDERSSTELNSLRENLNLSNTKIEVLGFQKQVTDRPHAGELLLLQRQAAAVQALSEAGFEPNNITVSSFQTNNNDLANAVELRVTTPPKPVVAVPTRNAAKRTVKKLLH